MHKVVVIVAVVGAVAFAAAAAVVVDNVAAVAATCYRCSSTKISASELSREVLSRERAVVGWALALLLHVPCGHGHELVVVGDGAAGHGVHKVLGDAAGRGHAPAEGRSRRRHGWREREREREDILMIST